MVLSKLSLKNRKLKSSSYPRLCIYRLTGNTDSPVTEPSHIWWMEATEADQPLLCSISQVLHSIITLVIIASLGK